MRLGHLLRGIVFPFLRSQWHFAIHYCVIKQYSNNQLNGDTAITDRLCPSGCQYVRNATAQPPSRMGEHAIYLPILELMHIQYDIIYELTFTAESGGSTRA